MYSVSTLIFHLPIHYIIYIFNMSASRSLTVAMALLRDNLVAVTPTHLSFMAWHDGTAILLYNFYVYGENY